MSYSVAVSGYRHGLFSRVSTKLLNPLGVAIFQTDHEVSRGGTPKLEFMAGTHDQELPLSHSAITGTEPRADLISDE